MRRLFTFPFGCLPREGQAWRTDGSYRTSLSNLDGERRKLIERDAGGMGPRRRMKRAGERLWELCSARNVDGRELGRKPHGCRGL